MERVIGWKASIHAPFGGAQSRLFRPIDADMNRTDALTSAAR